MTTFYGPEKKIRGLEPSTVYSQAGEAADISIVSLDSRLRLEVAH